MPTQLSDPATAVRELALTDAERVVVEAMTVRLLRRDRATLTDPTRLALRSDQIVAGVDRVRDALGGIPDGTAALAGDLAVADATSAAVVDDAVAGLASLVASRSRALLVLIDVCLFTPDRTSWNSRARRRALAELTAALPQVDLSDLERVQYEVAAARRALAWRRIRWGRVVVAPSAAAPDDALRLAVATCVVAISEHRDAETVKQVVRELEERLGAVVAALGAPAGPVDRGRARQLGAALETAIDLIPASPRV